MNSYQEALRNKDITSVSTLLEGVREPLTKAKEFVVVVTVIFDKH